MIEPLTPVHVQNALAGAGLQIDVIFMDNPTATAPEAAAAVGAELGSIVKSLLFMVEDAPVLVLTAGDQKADDKKLAALYSVNRKKVKIAKPYECIAIAGYAPGGVPPIGHRHNSLKILIDENLGRYETVWAAAGASNTLFAIAFEALVKVTGGQVMSVAKEQT